MKALEVLWWDEAGLVQAETAMLVAFVALAGIGLWQHLSNAAANSANGMAQAFESGDAAMRPSAQPLSTHFVQPR